MAEDVNLPSDIIDMEDFEESTNALIYADSGVGKTVFSGDAGLIICTEKGAISAKRLGKKAKLWRAHTWEDVQAAYRWLKNNPYVFRWVAIDSGTEMQALLLRDILDKELEGNERNRDEDVPQIQDHQKWQLKFKRFIKAFCDLPCNVLFTALAMNVEDEEGNALVVPQFQGKGYQISSWVCAQMSVVGYMKKVNVKKKVGDETVVEEVRRIFFQHRKLPNDATIFAKDRYNVLGKFKDDITLLQMDALIGEDVEDLPPNPVTVAKPRKAAKAAKASEKAEAKPSPVVSDPDGYLVDPQGEKLPEPSGAGDDDEDLKLDED